MTGNPSAIHPDPNPCAQQFSDLLLNVARDADGIICSNMLSEPIRRLQPGDLPEDAYRCPGYTPEDFVGYEDSGMTMGAYLVSQCLRFRVTGEAEARQNAEAAFAGIEHTYQLGASSKEGLFPKPYGGRPSDQISRDQYLYAMAGLGLYQELADAGTARQIERMIAAMADYWIEIDYTSTYYNLPAATHLDDFMAPLFLGIIGIAMQRTGCPRFRQEYDRLFHDVQLGPRMPLTLRSLFRQGETYDGGTYFRQQSNPNLMKLLAVDLLWDIDPDNRVLWRQTLRAYREDEMYISLDQRTGLDHYIVGYDTQRDQTFLTEPGVIKELTNPLKLTSLTWGGRRQSAGSTKTALAALIYAERMQSPDDLKIARQVLKQIDTPQKCNKLVAPRPQDIPPGHAWETRVLRTAYLAFWQWAYWRSR